VYNGTVNITVQIEQQVDHFILHAASILSVNLITIDGPNGLVNGHIFRHRPHEYLMIRFERAQPIGTYVLSLNFTTSLMQSGCLGFYFSNYTTEVREIAHFAFTQFEFYNSRRAFPGYDEPTFESTFDVTIVHDKSMHATLSSMAILSATQVQGMPHWIETKFQQTPKIASHLLAMLISDFTCETSVHNQITYRVCAAHSQKHKMGYALAITPKCIEHLQMTTGVVSPFFKVDLIAIPDFSNKANSTNWGLFTFDETALLYSAVETAPSAKMKIVFNIAHEFARIVSAIFVC